ncbi:hypothetical protein HDU92_004776 [Lobulomyces angularis]|nr:hypothetical protein HDU92_004776 [Lobulomyces angularis]
MQEVTIKPKSIFKHHVTVESSGRELYWNFTTKFKNLSFGLFKRVEASERLSISLLTQSGTVISEKGSFTALPKEKLNGEMILNNGSKLSNAQKDSNDNLQSLSNSTSKKSGQKVLDLIKEPGFDLIEIVPVSHYESKVDPTNTVKREYDGWILKKGDKKKQGYSKRWLKIDCDGKLQYFKTPGGASRASLMLSKAAVRLSHDQLLIDIDSGQNIFHFKAISAQDFQKVISVIEVYVVVTDFQAEEQADSVTSNNATVKSNFTLSKVTIPEVMENQKEIDNLIASLGNQITNLNGISLSLKSKLNGKPSSKDVIQSLNLINQSIQDIHNSTLKVKENITQTNLNYQMVLDHVKLTENLFQDSINDNNKLRGLLGLEAVNRNYFVTRLSARNSQSLYSLQTNDVFYDAELQKLDDQSDDEDQLNLEIDLNIGTHSRQESLENVNERNASSCSNLSNFDEDNNSNARSASFLQVATAIPSVEAPRKRRITLPAPTSSMQNVSIMSILRNNVGKDLSTVAMPIVLNEPLNLLQKLCEELEYSELLDQAAESNDPTERLLLISAFAVSGYASTINRAGRKPFNPLLGETFEYIREDKGFKFISEKVSHHPPIMACHAEGKNYSFFQDSFVKPKFWGKSMELIPSGTTHVILKNRNEHYTWGKVTTCMRNIFSGNRYVEHYGTMNVKNHSIGSVCQLQFKESSYFSTSKNEISGSVFDIKGKKLCSIRGKWDESFNKYEDATPNTLQVIWRSKPAPPNHQDMYGFSYFAADLNDLTPDLTKYLPKTDTRFRPDQRKYEQGHVEEAEIEKQRLEQKQRDARKKNEDVFAPSWFELKNSAEESKENSASGVEGKSWQLKTDSSYWDKRGNFKNELDLFS